MYLHSSPPDIQAETNWKGFKVTPKRGTMFGWTKRFHNTASRQKACVICQRWEAVVSETHLFSSLRRADLEPFDGHLRVIIEPFVYIVGAPRGYRPLSGAHESG